MVKQKKKARLPKSKHNKRLVIAASIIGVLLLAAGGLWLRSYLVEKVSIGELSRLSEDVEGIYARLLEASGGNIASSQYGNNCSESSVEIGKGRIVCWTGGVIRLKQDVGLKTASNSMEDSVKGSALGSNTEAVTSSSQYYTGVSIKYRSPYKDVICDGSYGQNTNTRTWSYSVSCRKTVPNFLPGYTVTE